MSTDRYLTRVTLRRDAPIAALRSVFIPEGGERRTVIGHQLMWTLFADSPDRERDFLWREAGDGRFYTLSARPPSDRHDVFIIDSPKAFAPELREGDRLRFSLRANATVSKRAEGKTRGTRADVVMDALYQYAKGGERGKHRSTAIQAAGLQWLARQGAQGGFSISWDEASPASGTARVTSYQAMQLDHKRSAMKIGVLEYEGDLVVTEPKTFVAAIANGFGRAKAFGCGLMLIRRA